jgi:hypothetical protein
MCLVVLTRSNDSLVLDEYIYEMSADLIVGLC